MRANVRLVFAKKRAFERNVEMRSAADDCKQSEAEKRRLDVMHAD